MPEGDTLHRVAAAIRPSLVGERLVRAVVRGDDDPDLEGRRVTGVGARGKHLLVTLDGERVVRSHLGMYGTWHRYAPGEPWEKPERRASIALWTPQAVLVCFDAKRAEVMRVGGVAARALSARLGPDLVAEEPRGSDLARRARTLGDPGAPVAEVLLDERIASGIGNVYKSEVLFVERVHPRAALADLPDATIARVYESAAALLRRNLAGGPRTTRFERDGRGRLWVYRRAGAPCLACATAIEWARIGRAHRSTYWCPACQAGSGESSDAG